MSKPSVWINFTDLEQVESVPSSKAACGDCGDSTVTELTGSSQPQRLLKVTRAFNTWKRGISKSAKGRWFSKMILNALLICVMSLFSPIFTGKPGGRRKVMKSRSLAKWAFDIAMRSMMGVTCSASERG